MKRPSTTRKTRDTVLILTNGRTEKCYFDSITSGFRSIYKIDARYKNCQCNELVRWATEFDASYFNQIWCVFDIDDELKEGHLLQALKLAADNNIKIAFSNEAFEVWLLYHLSSSVPSSLTRNTYGKEINKQLKSQGKSVKYAKANKNLLTTEFIPKIQVATESAKRAYQLLEAAHQRVYFNNTNYPIWDWKSATTVYKLIEVLQLTKCAE